MRGPLAGPDPAIPARPGSGAPGGGSALPRGSGNTWTWKGAAMPGDMSKAFLAYPTWLYFDGIVVGHLEDAYGGFMTAPVIEEKVGPVYFLRKHIGNPRCEPIEM